MTSFTYIHVCLVAYFLHKKIQINPEKIFNKISPAFKWYMIFLFHLLNKNFVLKYA